MAEYPRDDQAVAHRFAKHLVYQFRNSSHFRRENVEDAASILLDTVLEPHERVIGIYENAAGSPICAVVVSTWAVHVRWPFEVDSVAYRDITEVDLVPPRDNKQRAIAVVLLTRDGRNVTVPFIHGTGENERFRDAWAAYIALRKLVGRSGKWQNPTAYPEV